jgi:hypothetical protein
MFFHEFSIKAIWRKVQINIRKSKLNGSNVTDKTTYMYANTPCQIHLNVTPPLNDAELDCLDDGSLANSRRR